MAEATLEYIVKVQDRDLKELRSQLKATHAEAAEGSGHLGKLGESYKELGKTMLAAGAGMFAAEGVIEGFKATFEGGEKLEKSQKSLEAAIKSTGGNVEELAPKYEATAKAAAQFGIDQATATQSLARATLLTGNAASAQHAYQEALVISKATGKDFDAVLTATSKAQDGMLGSLTRYGVTLKKGADGQEQYTQVMKRFGDQAAANTTPLEQLHAHVQNFEEELGTKLVPIINDVINFVAANWPTISAVFSAVAGAIGSVINGVIIPVFQNVLIPAVQAVIAFVRQHWPEIKAIVEAIAHDVEAVLNALKAFWDRWGKDIMRVLKLEFDAVKTYFVVIFDVIKGVIQVALDLIQGKWGKAWNDAKNTVTNVFNAIVSFLRNLVGTVLHIAGDIGGAILNGILGAVKDLGSKLGSLISGAISDMVHALEAVDIHFKLPSIDTHIPGVGKIGGESFDFHPFAALAEGGVVTKPTFALMGEAGPEAVIPLNRAGGLGGGNLYLTVHGNVLTKDDLLRELEVGFTQMKKRNGSLAFA